MEIKTDMMIRVRIVIIGFILMLVGQAQSQESSFVRVHRLTETGYTLSIDLTEQIDTVRDVIVSYLDDKDRPLVNDFAQIHRYQEYYELLHQEDREVIYTGGHIQLNTTDELFKYNYQKSVQITLKDSSQKTIKTLLYKL